MLDLEKLSDDDWSEWVCIGNGTHRRYVKDHPTVAVTEPCWPADETEQYCGCCGGYFINRGTCVALEDIELYAGLEHVNDEIGPTVLCVIPKDARFEVTRNFSDYAMAEYNGYAGYIAAKFLNFVTE